MSFVSVDAVGYVYHQDPVLQGITAQFEKGELVAIIGPNGAGKSTLLHILAGLRRNYSGSSKLDGREITAWPRREFAKRVALVPQMLRFEFPFTCEQVVLMGRAPYGDGIFDTEEDHQAARDALERTGSTAFANRDFRELSGGERQRVILSSALAQSPDVLLLDEPTTFLDIKHQLAIYRLLKDLCRNGLLAVAVTHDLNLAASFADRMMVLEHGRMRALGTIDEVLRPELLREVFDAPAVVHQREDGRRWISYD